MSQNNLDIHKIGKKIGLLVHTKNLFVLDLIN
jgi:hypothetical protein